MFFDNRLSNPTVAWYYTYPYTLIPDTPLIAYALGGVALGDTSRGMDYQLWTMEWSNGSFNLHAENQPVPIAVYLGNNVTEMNFTFDQNMNIAIAGVQDEQAFLYWYDTIVRDYVHTWLSDCTSPRITLDDRRELQTTNSDMILSYIYDNSLRMRRQRDRFGVEYLLKDNIDGRILQMGMNVRMRLQWKIKLREA